MTKRVLLTGASGFVGAHCLEHLLRSTDWEILCPVSWRHKGVAERVAQVLGYSEPATMDNLDKHLDWRNRVTLIQHDLTAPFSEVAIAKMGRIDYIWNVASESHVDTSITDPRPFVENNVAIALTIAELCRRLRPDLLLQMSTDEVYGPAAPGQFHAEWDTVKPSNPYSASKAAQEAILYSYWRTYAIPLVITNTMNIIGEMQDPEKFMPMVLRRVLAGEKVTIHATPEGISGSRCWLHARNLADAWLWITNNLDRLMLTYPRAHDPQRLHIVGDELTNLQLAELIASCVDRELHYVMENAHSQRPGHDIRYALDGSKIESLGWKPPVSLTESLRKTVEWTLGRPEWLA